MTLGEYDTRKRVEKSDNLFNFVHRRVTGVVALGLGGAAHMIGGWTTVMVAMFVLTIVSVGELLRRV